MNSARVLWYLWARQFVNGVKRAIGTPRRLISILIGIGYPITILFRPWDSRTSVQVEKQFAPGFHVDPQMVDAGVFSIFMLISILFAVAIFSYRNTFKQSDVDVLFPLPISTKVVMIFRLLRDYATTMFLPIILTILTFQPAKGLYIAIKKNDPDALSHMIRGGLIAWLLMSLAWISISYALCFLVAKHEKHSKLIVNGIGWCIFLVVAITFGAFALQIRENPDFSTAAEAVSAPWLRAMMVIPSAATAIVMGGFQGSFFISALGAVVLIAISGGCLTYASRLSGWMYDQAATKGSQGQALRDFQRKGDYNSIAAERARLGKGGRSFIAKRVSNWNFRNGWTLIYKDILIQSRIGFWMNLLFLIIITMFGAMFLNFPRISPEGNVGAYMYLGITGFMAVNMSSFQAYNGFTETLKRVEVMKPLPLTSGQIAFFETVAKAASAMFMAFMPFVFGLVYKPLLWQFHVSGMIAAPFMALALLSAIFLIVVLFPDFDDPTQRQFRGIMQLIALVAVMIPTGLLFAGLIALGISPIVPAAISALVNIGATVLLTTIAGRFYADFNPSE